MSPRSSDGTLPSITSMFSNGMARTCASCNSVSELDADAPVRAKYAPKSTDSVCHMASPALDERLLQLGPCSSSVGLMTSTLHDEVRDFLTSRRARTTP